MKLPVLLSAAILAGCAQTHLVTANDRSVVVEGPLNAWATAQPIADAECSKAGLKSRFSYNTNGYPAKYFYDCVN